MLIKNAGIVHKFRIFNRQNFKYTFCFCAYFANNKDMLSQKRRVKNQLRKELRKAHQNDKNHIYHMSNWFYLPELNGYRHY